MVKVDTSRTVIILALGLLGNASVFATELKLESVAFPRIYTATPSERCLEFGKIITLRTTGCPQAKPIACSSSKGKGFFDTVFSGREIRSWTRLTFGCKEDEPRELRVLVSDIEPELARPTVDLARIKDEVTLTQEEVETGVLNVDSGKNGGRLRAIILGFERKARKDSVFKYEWSVVDGEFIVRWN